MEPADSGIGLIKGHSNRIFNIFLRQNDLETQFLLKKFQETEEKQSETTY